MHYNYGETGTIYLGHRQVGAQPQLTGQSCGYKHKVLMGQSVGIDACNASITKAGA